MGHDIYGFNKAGKEIAYARFSMGNTNSFVLYDLLNSLDFHAGVSGSGNYSTLSLKNMEEAMKHYNQTYNRGSDRKLLGWDQEQIHDFIHNCLKIAQKEGDVRVYFG